MRSRWMMSLFTAFLCAAVSAGAYADPRQPHWGGVAHDRGGREFLRDRGDGERWHGGDRGWDHDRHGWNPGWNGAWRFHDHDWDDWHHGHWEHDWYGGRFGWWWVVAGVWFFYPVPVYPFPDPYLYASPVVVEPPPYGVTPAAGYWYWCASAQAYYPYVTTCPDAWEPVPATEPANPPPPPPP